MKSFAFKGLSIDELGSLVRLAGTNRQDPNVNVIMSVHACQTGTGTSSCATTPGTKFSIPITLRIYSVDAAQEPGALIDTETVEQQLFYRPSSDPSCTTPPYAGGFIDGLGECANGELEPITFHLGGTTLPDEVIVSVSYNTSTTGYAPTGNSGGPADSLNVALQGPASVGTTARESEGSYFASGFYGSGDNVFQYQEDEDAGETEGTELAMSISATN